MKQATVYSLSLLFERRSIKPFPYLSLGMKLKPGQDLLSVIRGGNSKHDSVQLKGNRLPALLKLQIKQAIYNMLISGLFKDDYLL